MRTLSDHLSSCAACRQVEAAYRQVGESLRMLPTLTPDASFRERVFAAIAAERQRIGPAALRASRATTEPSLPVVRAPVPLTRAPRRIGPVPLTAMVAAAVLVVSLVAMQWISGRSASGLAANISRQPSVSTTQSHLSSYLPDQRFYQVNDVQATRDWLAYAASDGAGSDMLYVVSRENGATHAILTSPATGQVTLISVSRHWVVWTVSSTVGWAVSAAPLTGASAWRAQTLAQGVSSTLTGAWANDTEALVATSTSGEAILQRMSIASSETSAVVIATGSHPGAIITNPSLAGDAVYWADVWADLQGSLHSAIWSATPAGIGPITQAGGEAFAPVTASGYLTWVNASHALSVDAKGGAAAVLAACGQATGKLIALALHSGVTVTLTSETASTSVHLAGGLALWSAGGAAQGYDLAARRALSQNSLLAHAQVTGATSDALAWFDGSHLVVYELN
ncbi:MAG TPA: hypothetical protein VF808_07140 [Ktedonobacterales bacterium]